MEIQWSKLRIRGNYIEMMCQKKAGIEGDIDVVILCKFNLGNRGLEERMWK